MLLVTSSWFGPWGLTIHCTFLISLKTISKKACKSWQYALFVKKLKKIETQRQWIHYNK